MSIIKKVTAREVLDSRGNPTVECDVVTEDGLFRSIVPSGASTGSYEAVELRDNEKRYMGKGVLKAVRNVNEVIANKIVGMDCREQESIDNVMIEIDGTENKSNIGANAILSVSMSVCKAGAHALKKPLYEYIAELSRRSGCVLPVPQLNVINGGKHAGIKNDIQEHMIMPIGAKTFSEAIRMSVETYHTLKNILKKRFGAQGMLLGDEGGFVPKLRNIQDRLDTILEAIKETGYENKIMLALDAASSEFFHINRYKIGQREYNSPELVDFYQELVSTYPIISIEDGMAEDDWEGWTELTKRLGKRIQIVGDDLLVTNPKRIKKAIELKAVNSLLVKINQIGTVTETIKAANLAFSAGWTVVVSHRSGETEDSFIADLAVGLCAGQSKFGAPARSERNAKYNQLLRIEESLGKKAKYIGRNFRKVE